MKYRFHILPDLPIYITGSDPVKVFPPFPDDIGAA
jgi:hypothetical protein